MASKIVGEAYHREYKRKKCKKIDLENIIESTQVTTPKKSPDIQNKNQLDEVYTKKKGETMKRKITIYEYFEAYGYTKEEVQSVFPDLSLKQQEVIQLRNGRDLENPTYQKLEGSNKQIYYTTLKTILAILKTKYGKRITKEKQEETNNADLKVEIATLVEENLQQEDEETLINQEQPNEIQTNSKNKKKLTIFEHFERKGYTKSEVMEFIPMLTENQLEIVKKKNGGNLDTPVYTRIETGKENYRAALKKIERYLEQKHAKRETQQDVKFEITDDIEIQASEPKEEVITEQLTVQEKHQSTQELTKDEYIKILELLKTPTFGELMTQLDPKSAVVISLRLGYVDNKYYSTSSIAEFLGIEESEVRTITTQTLTLYKNNINNFIDKAISYQDTNNHIKKLT
jgi:hypothetical protein